LATLARVCWIHTYAAKDKKNAVWCCRDLKVCLHETSLFDLSYGTTSSYGTNAARLIKWCGAGRQN
jgi:hypothetical protein